MFPQSAMVEVVSATKTIPIVEQHATRSEEQERRQHPASRYGSSSMIMYQMVWHVSGIWQPRGGDGVRWKVVK